MVHNSVIHDTACGSSDNHILLRRCILLALVTEISTHTKNKTAAAVEKQQ